MTTRIETFAMFAVALSGLLWGVFWMPLRALETAGVHGIWSVATFNVLPALLMLPVFVYRFQRLKDAGATLHIAGLISGTALVLYGGSLLFTDVVRALMFFYLTPIWSTILGRIFLSERITLARWGTIILGFSGMLCVLRFEGGLNADVNIGDVMGLVSGVLWAVASVVMKSSKNINGLDFTLSFFFWASLISICLAVNMAEAGTAPDWTTLAPVLIWLIPVILFLAIPASTAIIWGATIISPGLLAILLMTELSAGAITAAIWAGEPFGVREALGVLLITLAGVFEPALSMLRKPAKDVKA